MKYTPRLMEIDAEQWDQTPSSAARIADLIGVEVSVDAIGWSLNVGYVGSILRTMHPGDYVYKEDWYRDEDGPKLVIVKEDFFEKYFEIVPGQVKHEWPPELCEERGKGEVT